MHVIDSAADGRAIKAGDERRVPATVNLNLGQLQRRRWTRRR